MSISDHALTDHAARTVDRFDRIGRLLATVSAVAVRSVRTVAFWVAVALPLSYLPLLVTGVIAERPLGFAALLCVNVTAFVLGHTHNRQTRDTAHSGDAVR